MRLPLMAFALAAVLCPGAGATAFAGVNLAFWQADFSYYADPSLGALTSLPDGVTIECTGSAWQTGNGCRDQKGISVVSNGPLKSGLVDAWSGLLLRNTGAADFPGAFVFETRFSSFNPGGPEIGAHVDNPAREFASFFTVVSGPGVFDLHGCTMNHGGGGPAPAGGAGCGVSSPDSSIGEALFGPLSPGGTISADYNIFIQVIAQGADPVPEPATFVLLCAGLFALPLTASRRKARSPCRQTRPPSWWKAWSHRRP